VASNDLPALVREVAEAAGRDLGYAVLLAPGASLEEHWNAGAEEVISEVGADVVILQQGPSSLPESQEHLRTWAERFAVPIRQAGGTPALLAGWERDPDLALYGADGFHPSELGSLVAALTVYAVLFDGDVTPCRQRRRQACPGRRSRYSSRPWRRSCRRRRQLRVRHDTRSWWSPGALCERRHRSASQRDLGWCPRPVVITGCGPVKPQASTST